MLPAVQFWIEPLALTLVFLGLLVWDRAARDIGKGKKTVEGLSCPKCGTMTMEECKLCPHCNSIMEVIQTSDVKVSIWQCESQVCSEISYAPCASCQKCHGLTRRLQFESMALLEMYAMHAEMTQTRERVERYVPGVLFSQQTLMRIDNFLIEHDRMPTTQEITVMDESISTQEHILSTKQATIINKNRLLFAKWLVDHGRLSEEITN